MKITFNNKVPALDVDPYRVQAAAQAIKIMFGNLPRIAISVALMILVMVLVMWEQIDHLTLLVWATVVLMISAAEIQFGKAFFRRKLSLEETVQWGHYYSFISVANGLAWGMACVLFFVSDSAALQVFLFTCMVGLATASIIQHSYWIESYYAFTVPMLALSGLRLYLEGGIAYQGLALLTLALLAIVIQMAHESQKSVLAAIRLRFENLDLIERLSVEKEKAEIASSDKTRFLASASHDLRQPVHALTLFANALQSELVSMKGKTLLNNIERSIEAINQLLSSLLDISKLDANIVKANPEHFAIRNLFNQLDAEYAPQAHAKGLGWHVNNSDIIIYSDQALLEVMLRNLISNAVRYTQRGHVEVQCLQHGEQVRIEIIDTGIGIPDDQKKEIFREFYQVDNSERDRAKGLGLGLAIVERVASLLQHEIILESQSGKGSQFTIVLPAGKSMAVAAPTASPFVGQRDANGMIILVIEDELEVREGMQAVLEGWGCAVVLASSEDEALEKLHGVASPHVIVADYRLRDGKTGVEAIERLRHCCGKDIPALVITGDTDPARLREAQASGHTLMHKPVQPAKLRSYLRGVQRRKA
jgi:signal transduction histidine kinase/CheY-like chemotaxis protein